MHNESLKSMVKRNKKKNNTEQDSLTLISDKFLCHHVLSLIKEVINEIMPL